MDGPRFDPAARIFWFVQNDGKQMPCNIVVRMVKDHGLSVVPWISQLQA